MYSTCMFCHRDLGENRVLETFPVGRRLAFDASKGRLWVVCRKCERWNLSPLEERWEAIEDAERMYRGTHLRSSTENIGLARLPDGLELVRIGRPHRPEFAAWRYGDQFGRRRRRAIAYGAAGVVALGGLAVGAVTAGVLTGGFLAQIPNFVNLAVSLRSRVKIRTDDGRVIKLRLPDLRQARIIPADDPERGWGLELRRGTLTQRSPDVFYGAEAERVAGLILPKINHDGASASQVRRAVRAIERAGHPASFLEEVTAMKPDRVLRYWKDEGTLMRLKKPTRLAVEMALHEEQERRALQGELRALELAWREAEEIAAISDDLLLPDGTEDRLKEMKERARDG